MGAYILGTTRVMDYHQNLVPPLYGPVGGSCRRESFGFAGLWLAGNEGTEKKMETTVLG